MPERGLTGFGGGGRKRSIRCLIGGGILRVRGTRRGREGLGLVTGSASLMGRLDQPPHHLEAVVCSMCMNSKLGLFVPLLVLWGFPRGLMFASMKVRLYLLI